MNKGLIARYHNSSGQIEEWAPQLKTTPFQGKLFIFVTRFAETAADHGNILLAPMMYAITEALTYGILWLHKS